MQFFLDFFNRQIRLTDERYAHLVADHPEMGNQFEKIAETLRSPEKVVKSKTDEKVVLYYRLYLSTPVTQKYMCVVVKISNEDAFAITAYFTNTIKKGETIWPKK